MPRKRRRAKGTRRPKAAGFWREVSTHVVADVISSTLNDVRRALIAAAFGAAIWLWPKPPSPNVCSLGHGPTASVQLSRKRLDGRRQGGAGHQGTAPEARAYVMAWLVKYFNDSRGMFSPQITQERRKVTIDATAYWLVKVPGK